MTELRHAGIQCVTLEYDDKAFSRMEVHSKVGGELDDIRFTRSWCYWVAEGPVPLAVARRLYADPACRHDVRVNGHCGAPAPEGWQVKWYDAAIRRMLPLAERQHAEELLRSSVPSLVAQAKSILDTSVFTDQPEKEGGQGFVDLYHIDSEVGLRVFADYLSGGSRRERRLEKALLLVEGLCLAGEPDNEFVGQVYTVVHAATGHCCPPGERWEQELVALSESLKKNRIIDVDSIMRKGPKHHV